ncbi:hypothetical protein D3C85_1882960 [compost metagenome]
MIKVWDRAQGLAVVGPNAGVTFRGNGMATANNFFVKPTQCSGQQKRTIAVSVTGTATLKKAGC